MQKFDFDIVHIDILSLSLGMHNTGSSRPCKSSVITFCQTMTSHYAYSGRRESNELDIFSSSNNPASKISSNIYDVPNPSHRRVSNAYEDPNNFSPLEQPPSGRKQNPTPNTQLGYENPTTNTDQGPLNAIPQSKYRLFIKVIFFGAIVGVLLVSTALITHYVSRGNGYGSQFLPNESPAIMDNQAELASYLPSGPQVNIPLERVTSGGWTQCHSQLFSVRIVDEKYQERRKAQGFYTPMFGIEAKCNRSGR